VLDTWRRKWQAKASSVPPGSDCVVELEDLDVAMLGDLVNRAVICYYTKQCDLIGQLFIDYAEQNFEVNSIAS
jgi:glutathione peroxidase-family protein